MNKNNKEDDVQDTIADTKTESEMKEIKEIWEGASFDALTELTANIIMQAIADLEINLEPYQERMLKYRHEKTKEGKDKFKRYTNEYNEAKFAKEDAKEFFSDGRFEYLIGGFDFSEQHINVIRQRVKELIG